MPDTYSGLHAPDGGEPVEPSPPNDGDPTDVALLANSIEKARVRLFQTSGGGAVAEPPVGSLVFPLASDVTGTNYAGQYSRAVEGVGHRIVCAQAGMYRVSYGAHAAGTGLTGYTSIRATGGVVGRIGAAGFDSDASHTQRPTGSGCVVVTAGDGIWIEAEVITAGSAPGWNCYLTYLQIERVSG